MTSIRWPAVAVAVLVLTSCGELSAAPSAERVDITSRAIAAIALDHLDGEASERGPTYTDARSPAGLLGTDLRYRPSPGDDGDLVRVALAPGEPERDPCETSLCVDLETDVDGARMILRWEELVPEEDPGVVSVMLLRDDEYSFAYVSGPAITGDPRELDLPVAVEDLAAVVEDPRLRLRTSPEAVAAGEALEGWTGEDPEPVEAPPATGSADLTDRAVAAVVIERLPGADFALGAEDHWGDLVGAEVVYGVPDAVRVSVGAGRSGDPCAAYPCQERPTSVEGGALLAGEDDLGPVLVLRLADQTVVVRQFGTRFTERQLLGVLEDPRLRLVTDASVVQEGEALDAWED